MMNIETAIDVIESLSGTTDESTPAGEAWATILSFLYARPASTVQAIPEREELAGLLEELAGALHGYSILHPTHCADVQYQKARAAAKRLRGGGSDG